MDRRGRKISCFPDMLGYGMLYMKPLVLTEPTPTQKAQNIVCPDVEFCCSDKSRNSNGTAQHSRERLVGDSCTGCGCGGGGRRRSGAVVCARGRRGGGLARAWHLVGQLGRGRGAVVEVGIWHGWEGIDTVEQDHGHAAAQMGLNVAIWVAS